MTNPIFRPQRIVLLLALLAPLWLSAPSAVRAQSTPGAAWGEIRMPTSPLNVRESRDQDGKYVTTLHKGERVRVHYLRDGWYAVFPPDAAVNDESKAIGYARASYLVPAGAPGKADWGEIRYADRMLTVRRERTRNSPHVHTLHPGDEVRVDDLRDDWYAIYPVDAASPAPENRIGYSFAEYLLPTGKTPSASTAAPGIESAAQTAPTPHPAAQPEPAAAKAQAWGVLKTLPEHMVVRAGRSFDASPKKFLRAGDTVRLDFPGNGWWAAFPEFATVRDEKLALGYIPGDEAVRENTRLEAEAAEKARTQHEADPVVQRPTAVHAEPSRAAPEPAQEFVSMPSAASNAASIASTASAPGDDADLHIRIAPPGASQPPLATDEVRQGIRYSIFDRRDGGSAQNQRTALRVYIDVNVLPTREVLRDFANTVWKEKRLTGREMQVDIYLPGMNRNDLAYATARFNDDGLREFWTRETVLFGTRFKSRGD